MICLALVCMEGMLSGVPVAYAAGVPGGNIADPVVRAVDIAKPAVVRILTQVVGQLTVNFSNGKSVTFPLAPQNGVNGYPLVLSGTGTFISAHGDILTADHVINPVQDDRTALDQGLDQLAAQDVANYINQNLKPAQPVTADQVTQELIAGSLASNTQYQQTLSRVYLSTDFTGPLSAPDFQSIPPSQYANVDQVKEQSPFTAMDVAIVHVSGMDNMAMVQLGDSSAVQEQDQLTIIGFPGNGDVSTAPSDLLHSSINQVLVSSIKTLNGASPLIQVSGNVEQGDSGGPALDSHGTVVGIVSFGAAATAGSTSFLRASNSAKQLMQAAGIDTTPSAFQQAWSKAFNDYASQAPGHWHAAAQEFQQIANQRPQFKAISPFLQYATQQAQTEKQTQGPTSNGSPNGVAGSSTLNALYIVAGGAALLIILIGGGLVVSRRRKPAVATASPMAPGQMAGYNTPPVSNFTSAPGQGYGAAQGNSVSGFYSSQPGQSAPPVTPQPSAYPSQLAQQRMPVYPSQQAASVPQQSYRPQQGTPMPQQAFPSSTASSMTAFGAPPVPVTPQPTTASPDATLVPRPNTPVAQWRIWPCGHTNRSDARFCGICGESAPPLVRRVEQ